MRNYWTHLCAMTHLQLQSGQGLRFAGVHGSTSYHRLATRAVSVALSKVAQAGFLRRGLSGPRKPGSSFGRWSPLVGLGHKSRRMHSLKGIVPEVAAYVGGFGRSLWRWRRRATTRVYSCFYSTCAHAEAVGRWHRRASCRQGYYDASGATAHHCTVCAHA